MLKQKELKSAQMQISCNRYLFKINYLMTFYIQQELDHIQTTLVLELSFHIKALHILLMDQ